MTDAKNRSARVSGQRVTIPFPLRKIPLRMIRKYLAGMRYVKNWMMRGMLEIGKMKPERIKEGRSVNAT
jgi:hypothetical protein